MYWSGQTGSLIDAINEHIEFSSSSFVITNQYANEKRTHSAGMCMLPRSCRIYQLLVKNAPALNSLTWSVAVYSVSHGRYWHFTANLLFYTNFNARSVIRCGRGVEFQPPSSSSFSLGYSSPLPVLWKSSFPLQNPRALIFLTHQHLTHHRTPTLLSSALAVLDRQESCVSVSWDRQWAQGHSTPPLLKGGITDQTVGTDPSGEAVFTAVASLHAW